MSATKITQLEQRVDTLQKELDAANSRQKSLENVTRELLDLKELLDTRSYSSGESSKWSAIKKETLFFLFVEISAFVLGIIGAVTMEEGTTKDITMALTVVIFVVIIGHLAFSLNHKKKKYG